MPDVTLSAGVLSYEDSGGDGPIVVLVGGLAMSASVWRTVVAELSPTHRCLALTLPLGSHRRPMNPYADLSTRGLARLEGEFLEVLDLADVTLVGNDSGAFLFTAAQDVGRISRLVITTCEAFENFPPGLPGSSLVWSARLPGGVALSAQALRCRFLRRLPMTYGWMSKRSVPHEIVDAWVAPLVGSREIRRDLRKYLLTAQRGDMLAAAEELRSFDRPTLVVWTPEDRVMKPEHGRRFADLLPHARLVEIEDSFTLIPEDQPLVLARHIREFVATSGAGR